MVVEEEGVPEDRAGAEEAEAVRPLHRGLAVAADHLAHLADALRDMHGEGQAALPRRGAAVAQQIGGAGVDLHRRDDARQPAAGMGERRVDGAERGGKAGAAARLVPGVAQLVVVFEIPPRRGIAGREKAAQPALREQLDPARPGRRDVDEAGDAGEQELAIGEFGACRAGLVIGRRQRLRALVEPGHVHARQAVLLADAAVERLVLGVGMDVDEAGQHQPRAAVDDPVGRRPRNRARERRCGRR